MGSRSACLRRTLHTAMVCSLLLILTLTGLPVEPVAAQSAPLPRLLIICADPFLPALPPLVALKEGQGFAVTVKPLSETGPTREQIKAAITAQYSGPTPPDYLLLVGDQDSIPPWESRTYTGFTDLYYATMGSAGDYQADILLGRLAVRTIAQLEAVIAKWTAAQALSFEKISLIATDDPQQFSTVEATYLDMISTYTLPAGYLGSFPNDPQPGGDRLFAGTHGAETADVQQALRENRALVVYSGRTSTGAWSGPALSQAQVRAMDTGLAAMVASFAGDTASFAPTESFADSWVLQPQAGALVFIGAAGATPWTQDDVFQRAFFQALFSPLEHETSGQVLQAALTEFDSRYFYESDRRRYHELYQLIGDPTLQTPMRARENEFSVHLEPSQAETCAPGEAQVRVELSSSYPLTSTALLSASGLPFGVQALWEPAQAAIPGESLLTLQAQAGALADKVLVSLEAATPAQTQYGFLSLRVQTAAPLRPVLLSPTYAARDTSLRPTFTWSAAEQASRFTLEIARDPAFTDQVFRVEDLTQTSHTLAEPLQPGERYTWRVTAENSCGASEPSYPASFITRPLPGSCAVGDTLLPVATGAANAPFSGWSVDPVDAAWNLLPGAAFGRDTPVFAGKAAAGVQNLVSIPLPLPENTRNLTLNFDSWTNFGSADASLHGGLVELSGDGGATWQPLAESALLSTPYDGPLTSLYGNPLGGSLAWLGSSGGWRPVSIDLSALAGESLQARFRLGASSAPLTGDWHWALTGVTAQACSGAPDVAAQILPANQIKVIAPGGEQAYEFELTNSGKPASFSLQVEPAGWPVEVTPPSLSLPAGGTQTVRVTLHPPPGADAGSLHSFQLIASSPDDALLHVSASFQAQIQLVGLELQPVEMALVGKPAQWLRFCVWVTNTGNVPDEYHVTAVSAAGWEVSLSKDVIQLQPGQSAELQMKVHIPLDAHPSQQDQIDVQVRSTVDPLVRQNVSLTARVAGTDTLPASCVPLNG